MIQRMTPSESLNMVNYPLIQIRISGREIQTKMHGNYFPTKEALVDIFLSDEKVSGVTSLPLTKLNHETTHLFKSLENDCPVVFYFEKDNFKIKFPDTISKNLVKFFKEYKPKHNKAYCCINFAYEMLYGREVVFHDNRITAIEPKPLKPFCEADLTPGCPVYLFKQNSRKRQNPHFAIYIGGRSKSYLSLFGNTNPLMITSLDAMKIAWDAPTVVELEKGETHFKTKYKTDDTKPAGNRKNIVLMGGLIAATATLGLLLFGPKKWNDTGLNHSIPFTP